MARIEAGAVVIDFRPVRGCSMAIDPDLYQAKGPSNRNKRTHIMVQPGCLIGARNLAAPSWAEGSYDNEFREIYRSRARVCAIRPIASLARRPPAICARAPAQGPA